MKKRSKHTVARNAVELSELLGLNPKDAVEMDFRAQLNAKIIEVVRSEGLTHAGLAKLARTSRTRVTAILNGNTSGVSSDLLLRILYSLGYRAKATFTRVKLAA